MGIRPSKLLSAPWILILVAVVTFFLVSSTLAYRSIGVMSENNRQVNNTLHVISLIKDLKTELIAAESGQRGYLLTSKPQYLEPYHQAMGAIDRLLEVIKNTTAELPLQRERFEILQDRTLEKIEFMRQAIKLVDNERESVALDQFDSDKGMELMRSIIALIEEMEADELWLLNEHRNEAKQKRDLIIWILMAANLIGLMLALGIYFLVYMNSNKVARLYREIEQVNSDLEDKVAERTQALEQFSDELQRSNRELEEFAFVASHDLQEPLRKIRAFGDRLLQKYSDDMGDRGKDYVQRMHNASERMSVLIDDLLSFSRVTTRQKPFEWVDLNETLEQVTSDLEYAIESAGAKLEVDELPKIEADQSQIGQVFMNLISNSIKFCKQDVSPVITVTNELFEVDAEESNSGPWCRIRIKDNGIGFDQQFSDRIFSLFQRLHGRDQYSGTGIGLALCRKIIERHNGSIIASSEPGEGAEFIIELPINQPKIEELAA